MAKKRSAKRIQPKVTETLENRLEGMHFEVLQDWVDKGRQEELPEEMVRYLEQLTFVNGLWNQCNSPGTIINKLTVTFKDLDRISAKKRFEDAVTYFYLDDQVKQEAYRNMMFEKMLKLADAAILSAKDVDDYNKASLILERAYRIKGLDKDEEAGIPDSAFDKPIKVYSNDTTEFIDLPQNVDRHMLAARVDEWNITEEEKIKIKQDMGAEPRQLFDYNGAKEND